MLIMLWLDARLRHDLFEQCLRGGVSGCSMFCRARSRLHADSFARPHPAKFRRGAQQSAKRTQKIRLINTNQDVPDWVADCFEAAHAARFLAHLRYGVRRQHGLRRALSVVCSAGLCTHQCDGNRTIEQNQ